MKKKKGKKIRLGSNGVYEYVERYEKPSVVHQNNAIRDKILL